MSKISYFEKDGARVGYRDDGDGLPLVFVHGTGGDGEANFAGMMPHLPGRRVIRPDYAGSGLTVDPTKVLTLDRLVGQVIGAAEHAGLETFGLLGFSLGSAIAIRLAALYPERIDKLILIGGFISGASPRSQLQFQHWSNLAQKNPDALARLMLLTGFSHDFLTRTEDIEAIVSDMVEGTNWEGVARQAELDLSVDVSEDLKAVKAKTLVIGNQHDQMVDPAASELIANSISDGRLDWIKGPHLALMEKPEVVAELVQHHLAI